MAVLTLRGFQGSSQFFSDPVIGGFFPRHKPFKPSRQFIHLTIALRQSLIQRPPTTGTATAQAHAAVKIPLACPVTAQPGPWVQRVARVNGDNALVLQGHLVTETPHHRTPGFVHHIQALAFTVCNRLDRSDFRPPIAIQPSQLCGCEVDSRIVEPREIQGAEVIAHRHIRKIHRAGLDLDRCQGLFDHRGIKGRGQPRFRLFIRHTDYRRAWHPMQQHQSNIEQQVDDRRCPGTFVIALQHMNILSDCREGQIHPAQQRQRTFDPRRPQHTVQQQPASRLKARPTAFSIRDGLPVSQHHQRAGGIHKQVMLVVTAQRLRKELCLCRPPSKAQGTVGIAGSCRIRQPVQHAVAQGT